MHEEIDCSLIVDNVGGHLMQHNQIDMCIVGTDRTTLTGDVCNKIGTYLKAWQLTTIIYRFTYQLQFQV